MSERYDHLKRRCPILGGPVTFQYCRRYEGENQPCGRVFDCWWEYFDIVNYMRSCLSQSQFEALCKKRPKPKISSLLELIARAKSSKGCEKK